VEKGNEKKERALGFFLQGSPHAVKERGQGTNNTLPDGTRLHMLQYLR
jgi:hypothetical protein